MSLPVSQHHPLVGLTTAWILGALFGLLTFNGPLTSTEGTLPGAFAFPARARPGPRDAEDACATTPMAQAGAEAEGADVRAGGQVRS